MLRTRVLTALILGPVVLLVAWFREPWLSLGDARRGRGGAVGGREPPDRAGWPVPRVADRRAGSCGSPG